MWQTRRVRYLFEAASESAYPTREAVLVSLYQRFFWTFGSAELLGQKALNFSVFGAGLGSAAGRNPSSRPGL